MYCVIESVMYCQYLIKYLESCYIFALDSMVYFDFSISNGVNPLICLLLFYLFQITNFSRLFNIVFKALLSGFSMFIPHFTV